MYRHEFADLFELNVIVFKGYHDMVGRPIMHILSRNMKLKNVTPDHLKRYFCFMTDQVCSQMPPHVDQMVMMMDVHEFGYNNWFTDHFKQTMAFLQTINAERQYCTCIIR